MIESILTEAIVILSQNNVIKTKFLCVCVCVCIYI